MTGKTRQTKAHLSRGHALDLLREMLRIRRFEERCAELYMAEKIRGFLHLYIGEEANAVGAMQALTPEDNVVATYREHGHALARGVSMNGIRAEMYGKQEGCSRGRGGSMHLFDKATRFYGGNAIVGGGLPLAVGLALADRMRGRTAVTACFFGEGAVAEGEFHESLNLAALWRLPVLFICENNLYAMAATALPPSRWTAWMWLRLKPRRGAWQQRLAPAKAPASWNARPIASGRTRCSMLSSTAIRRKSKPGRRKGRSVASWIGLRKWARCIPKISKPWRPRLRLRSRSR